MYVVAFALHLIKMLLTFQVHEVQFIDEAEFFEKFDGAVNRGAIDVGLTLPRPRQQGGGVEMVPRLLNGFNEGAAL